MRALCGHDAAVAEWVGNRIGVVMTPPYTAIGFLDRAGTLVAGFVFYGYTPGGNIDIAIALSGRLTRGALRAVCQYAFVQIPATRITARPLRSHAAACDQLKRAGFVQECVARDYRGPGLDVLQLRLIAKDCRWLRV